MVGHAKHGHPALEARGVRAMPTYDGFAHAPGQPRLIYLSVPASPTVDEVIGDLLPYLAKLDCDTSGGVTGARYGACFMVGGPAEGLSLQSPCSRSSR